MIRALWRKRGDKSRPAGSSRRGRLMAVHQNVIVILGTAMVAVALVAIARGSKSYLLLPLLGMGVGTAVAGALLPWIVAVRHRGFEIETDRRHRSDDR